MLPLILASSSPYRRELLARLQLPFTHHAPDIDESAQPHENAQSLVCRLAEAKARALATTYPAALIIGSDQVAALADGTLLGKPHTLESALKPNYAPPAAPASRFTRGFVCSTATINGHK